MPSGVYLRTKKPVEERFWARVEKTPGCWIWTMARKKYFLSKYRYGRLNINGKNYRAHRISWEIHYGKIPKGLCVLHRCDNPCCVRPDHLFLGTRADNNRDTMLKGRKATGKRHGSYLHPEAMARKFTKKQILELREYYKNHNITQEELAKRFNMSRAHVWRIVNRIAWTHI